MTGIVCLDQEDGLLFNGRRQSRDRVVTEKILSITEGKPLWMSAYSRRIFPEDAPVCVAEEMCIRDRCRDGISAQKRIKRRDDESFRAGLCEQIQQRPDSVSEIKGLFRRPDPGCRTLQRG